RRTSMSFSQFPRKLAIGSSLPLVILLLAMLQVVAIPLASAHVSSQGNERASHTANTAVYNPGAQLLRQMVHNGRLAPTVHVLNSLPPTTIIQFPLVPSGIKAAFPKATGLVTIVRGDRTNSTSDTVTVDVQNMPPNITFTIF